MRTPETLTAAQRAARLKLSGENAPETSDSNETQVTSKNDRYREQARNALNLGSPRNATADLDPRAEADMSFALLDIGDIEPYKFNPRTLPNPFYDQIKASIRADGITNMLTVTRPPGAQRYAPYGGGNTRLKIARELFEEGDKRFARLNVLVKAWPGEAAVISAHLAENENRGDISFWEKAKGVAAFKREFELATGRVLTSNELNKELRQLGLNYGIKMVQNFAFAVENLDPVGPWVKSTELNEIIRPLISSFVDLSDTLGKKTEIRTAIEGVLTERKVRLVALQQRNEDREESERVPVQLDTDQLMVDLQDAVASALGVESAAIPLMASALAQNPRLDADSLRRVKPKPAPTPPPARGTVAPAEQVPLSGMLAPVPRSEPMPPPNQDSRDWGYQPQALTHVPGTEDASVYGKPDVLERDLQEIHDRFLALNELVPLYDMLNTAPAMPFGFLCDFPADNLATIDGQPVPQPAADYRIVIWKLLVVLSGQLDHEVCRQIFLPTSKLRWIQALAQGPDGFAETVLQKGHTLFKNGDIYAGGIEVAMLFNRDDVGPAVVRLLDTLQRFRAKHPERFPTEHAPLFSKGSFTT